jgi:hypothetical protein
MTVSASGALMSLADAHKRIYAFGGAKKIPSRKTWNFFIQATGLAYHHRRSAVYITNNGRAVVVSHHAPACIFLWLDDIQHYVLMICNSFGIDDIHAYRRDYIESYVEALVLQGLFVFLGVKTTPFTIAPLLRPFGLEGAIRYWQKCYRFLNV